MSGHKERAHAVIAASAAHRWANCTAAPLLEAEFPDTSSEAAKEGTLAHELCEGKANAYFFPEEYSKQKLSALKRKCKKSDLWDAEMDGYTEQYLDFLKNAAMEYENRPFVAIEKRLDLTPWIPEGFGTADCIMIGGDTLHVIDFKYGKGVPVAAEANEQMMLYALGAWAAYGLFYQVSQIKMSIVQPRIDNNSTWTIPLQQLENFGTFIKGKAEEAASGEGAFAPGDWCRFCRARATCRARADANVRLAFDENFEKAPDLIANNEIGRYITLGEAVAKWVEELKAHALSECLAGHEVDGYKAVAGRAIRAWTDQEAAFEAVIGSGVEEALLYEKKPLSLAQVEKLMGKKDFAAVAGDYVTTPPGKPTLAPAADKRPPITNKISAEEAFGKTEEKED